MVGYYDHNGAMMRDDVDRSIFRIAGFENISWPRGGSGSTVTWTKVRLSCAIYSFDAAPCALLLRVRLPAVCPALCPTAPLCVKAGTQQA